MTRRTLLTALVALACLLLMLWTVGKARERTCRKQLIAAGFPLSYAESLAPLQAEHARWRFVPLPVSDLSWNQILDKECAPGWNLVTASSWAPRAWQKLGAANYTPYYAENARAYDSGAWYQASRKAIAYFMDPRNFFNAADVFMFETLEYNAAVQTQDLVEDALTGSFMAGTKVDGGPKSFSELVLEIGRKLGVSPVFLAGRLTSEQGNGTVQARGRIGDSLMELATNRTGKVGKSVIWGKTFSQGGSNTLAVVGRGAATFNGIYNFFNIGACGTGLFEIRYNAWREAVSKETCRSYLGPWNTQSKSIEGGATKISELYLGTQRHTRYLQKFSVLPQAGRYRWKQYMQNIAAPLMEARNASRAYDEADALDAPHRFLIPVYSGLPSSPCADPAEGDSVFSPSD